MCAKAHNARFCDWSGEAQVSIESDSVPVASDVKTIVEAFYGDDSNVEVNWGHTIVWLYTSMYRNRSEVNMDLLRMALPYGSI